MLESHDLAPPTHSPLLRYEKRPCRSPEGGGLEGLFNVWIWLDQESELHALSAGMLRELALAIRRASNERDAVAIVLTGTGTRAFCVGGNVREYAEYYAGRPQEYRQYLRLFGDVLEAILRADKPVVNRVNGLRVAGGQELGLACDYSIASDLARFGQAGPRHGSAPIAGATDFLPLYLGYDRAVEHATLCELWSAHKAYRLGLVGRIVPVLRADGAFVPNPLVVTDRYLDSFGRIVLGEPLEGESLERGKASLARGTLDLSLLDEEVEALCAKLAQLLPECTLRTLEALRRHKIQHFETFAQDSRAWLALNMALEGRAGFRAFHEKVRPDRRLDVPKLRRALADGRPWDDSLLDDLVAGC